jgi:hypothetical protein
MLVAVSDIYFMGSCARVVNHTEYPSLVDLRGLLLDLVAQLLGALSRIRFSSVTERYFNEINSRRIDTSTARNESLSIMQGMRYLKLGVFQSPYPPCLPHTSTS